MPAPRAVLEALSELTVTSNDTGRSGFQLTFTLSNRSPLHTLFLLTGGSALPVLRVIAVTTLNGAPNVLIDGVVTNNQIVPGSGGHATLTVTGEDLSVLMDKQDFSAFPFPAVPFEGRVALLVAKYSFLGMIPLVLPSVLIDMVMPTSRIEGQRGTDFAYINALAARVGYVFYIDPGPVPGTNIAYWGPQIKVGVPQPALNINMDAHTNVLSLSFNFDNNRNAIPVAYYYNELTKAILPIPIPPVTPLNPPLGLVPPLPSRLEPVSDDLSKRSLPKAIMIGLSKAS